MLQDHFDIRRAWQATEYSGGKHFHSAAAQQGLGCWREESY